MAANASAIDTGVRCKIAQPCQASIAIAQEYDLPKQLSDTLPQYLQALELASKAWRFLPSSWSTIELGR